VDTEAFDALLLAGDPTSLTEAVALYRGPLLANLPDEWVLDAQEQYRIRIADTCERLGDQAEATGDLTGAVEWARRALGHDPVRESCHRAIVRRLAANGRGAEALDAYRRCEAVLDAELGVEPSAETKAIARRLRAGGVTIARSGATREGHPAGESCRNHGPVRRTDRRPGNGIGRGYYESLAGY
jgi:DNA-binding SARP family transcriptional activator